MRTGKSEPAEGGGDGREQEADADADNDNPWKVVAHSP